MDICPECQLPSDDDEDGHCPWCGARDADLLELVVWAELISMEEALR
jgi:endogenous inhibitor of DNA gyrase (YacG/DUF329 family)